MKFIARSPGNEVYGSLESEAELAVTFTPGLVELSNSVLVVVARSHVSVPV